MNPNIALAILQRLALAVQFIHDLGFVHLDIKPANIIYYKEDVSCKLTDFDSMITIGEKMSEISCSVEYGAPEMYDYVLSGSSGKTKEELQADAAAAMSAGNIDEAMAILARIKALDAPLVASTSMDMWSLGVTILYVFMAPTGFEDLPKDAEARRSIVSDGTFVQNLAKKVPLDKARRALYDGGATGDLLSLDPTCRMTMEQLRVRGLMSDKSTATSILGRATDAIVGGVRKGVKKELKGAVKDINSHTDEAVEAGGDFVVEKVAEEREK